MALHFHRAERTDLLADGLGELLSDPLPDPFAEELVIVPAKGVERWLSQRLSHVLGRGDGADGVCAGVSFRIPHSLIAEITGTVDDDPWSPDAMVWPLLEVIDGSLDEPWCRTLATHLGHFEQGAEEKELRQGRRYAVARRLAGLFASYARQRPQLLVDWESDISGDLASDLLWQPPLWRALLNRIDADPPHVRHAKTVARLQESPADLPERISLFGHTRLAVTDIELLRRARHPSRPAPVAATSQRRPLAVTRRPPQADPPPRRHQPSQRRTPAARDPRPRPSRTAARTTESRNRRIPWRRTKPDTLLGWLQSDIAANVRTTRRPRCTVRNDRSVQVHSCHGPARQIDVLREVLLGLLADDKTLEPRDILVMCPDIETYAPLIVAGFGLGDMIKGVHPAHRLRVRLADRSLVQTNPLLGVASQLLALAGGRATSTEVLNLAQAAPVRARFGFTDDNLEDITRWVRQSNIRWGFDREHRDRSASTSSRTLGVSVSTACSPASPCPTTPTPGSTPRCRLTTSSSNRVELAGQLAEYVDRLQHVVESLTGAQPLRDWLTALTDGIACSPASTTTTFGRSANWSASSAKC